MDGRTEIEAAAGEGATPVDAESDAETEAEVEGEPGAHLDDIEDGCGCAEVWEHMSDRRAED